MAKINPKTARAMYEATMQGNKDKTKAAIRRHTHAASCTLAYLHAWMSTHVHTDTQTRAHVCIHAYTHITTTRRRR